MRSMTLREVMVKKDTRRVPDVTPWVCSVTHRDTLLAIAVAKDFTEWMLRQLYPSRPSYFGQTYTLHLPESGDWTVTFEEGGYPLAARRIKDQNPVFNVVFNLQEPVIPDWLFKGKELKAVCAKLLHARHAWIKGAYGRSTLLLPRFK